MALREPWDDMPQTSPQPAKRLATVNDLLRLPRKPFYELYDGVFQVREGSSSQSSSVAAELLATLWVYLREHRLGQVFGADHRCVIARNPDTVLIPDMCFIRQSRLAYGTAWDRGFNGTPDLVLEVMSPSDRLTALYRKMDRYITAGTSLGWLIQPKHRTAVVFRKTGDPESLPREAILDGEDVVPGFRTPLASLFFPQDISLVRTDVP